MNIQNLSPDIEDVYFSPGFIQNIEDHLSLLRTEATITPVAISDHQSTVYEGDFYGLLDDNRIDKKYHFIILRVNGFESPNDYKGDNDYFIMPDLNEVEEIKMLYLTK